MEVMLESKVQHQWNVLDHLEAQVANLNLMHGVENMQDTKNVMIKRENRRLRYIIG